MKVSSAQSNPFPNQNKNMDVMRSWKACLATLGLSRVYYEKEDHFHGMAFVKFNLDEFSDVCWAESCKEADKMGRDAESLKDISTIRQLMVIPQDKDKKRPLIQ